MLKFKKVFFYLTLNLLSMTTHAKQASDLVTLPNPGQDLLKQATPIKHTPAKTKISFVVWLKTRHHQELFKLAQDVYDVNSPSYHHFLTPIVYEQQFAPTPIVEKKVLKFFTSQGMQAKLVRHDIHVTASAEQIEKTFHLHINDYQLNQSIAFANDTAPKLDKDIAQHIAEIRGLNTLQFTPKRIRYPIKQVKKVHDLHFVWNSSAPPLTANPTNISLQGFTGAQLQKVYNLENIPKIAGQKIDGSGQTLVIVDLCGTNTPEQILKDANQYFSANHIKPFITSGPDRNFAIINPDGTPFTHCPGASSFNDEIQLDIESSHTLAPGSNTVLVLGTDNKSTLTAVIDTLIQDRYTIAGFVNAAVISNSWRSEVETSAETEFETKLAQAANYGISVNFSSGDCGDDTYSTDNCTSPQASPAVNYPSSSAYVTTVGATAMFVDANYRYAFETVWGDFKLNPDNVTYRYKSGTGGGISAYIQSGAWQNSISSFTAGGYGVINNFGNRRAIPDIAMLGDPQTGLLIVSNNTQIKDGGTSLACPLFSATIILVNQARALLNKGTFIGQVAQYLYGNHNRILQEERALRVIIPPALIISGATPPPNTTISGTPPPASAFSIGGQNFGWDSALTIEPESQFWNDCVGVGSPYLPNFIIQMANM